MALDLRKIDELVAEHVMGSTLVPPLGYRMAQVGWRYISCTGPVFELRTGERLPMPEGRSIPQPEGTDDWNSRYAWYVAKHLGDRIAAEVDAVRYTPKAYSSDIAAAWEVVEEMKHLHPRLSYCDTTCSWSCTWQNLNEIIMVVEDTAPLAICLAALKAKGIES